MDSKKLINRVNSLKSRSSDIRSKLAHTLKALWTPRCKLAMAKGIESLDTIDDIDKASASRNFSSTGPLYRFVRKHSSKKFKDEALELELDASHINWILTANKFEAIPVPIMSRMMFFDIPLPTKDQMQNIDQSIYKYLRCSAHGY